MSGTREGSIKRMENMKAKGTWDIMRKRQSLARSAKRASPEEYRKRGLERYYKVRQTIITSLGSKCQICGGSSVLHIHHPFRRMKQGSRSSNSHIGWKKDLAEGNLALVCLACHRAFSRVLYWKRLGVLGKAVELAGEPE